jgi:endo-1,4-beta-D-glucanase Y
MKLAEPGRKALCALALTLAGVLANANAQPDVCAVHGWPQWQDFRQHFITVDGRVLAANDAARGSYSEGQSYGMFFSLVANDREAFEQIWRWTQQNLMVNGADGLPAWSWGQAADGQWRVLDANAAADADMWFAYALLEAGRLWQRDDYLRDGRRLLQAITQLEVVALPALGPMVLPGPFGFVQTDGSWRLNASYLPLPLLRRFELEVPQGPWADVAINTLKLTSAASPKGFTGDWTGYRAAAQHQPQFAVDPVTGPIGSYDAIRVYLWAGMTATNDPLAAQLLQALHGMDTALKSRALPPEAVDLTTGVDRGDGPFGFSAALLPYLATLGSTQALTQHAARSRQLLTQSLAPEQLLKGPPPYYDHVLSLFGLGWTDNRFHFLPNGQVQLKWQTTCSHANTL